jgi:hypothetical protein
MIGMSQRSHSEYPAFRQTPVRVYTPVSGKCQCCAVLSNLRMT